MVDLLRDGWFEGAVLLEYPCRGAWRGLAEIGTGKQSRLMFNRSCEMPRSSARIGMIRDVAQFGSALGSGPRGRWFKSSRPDQKSSGQRQKVSDLFLYPHFFLTGGIAALTETDGFGKWYERMPLAGS